MTSNTVDFAGDPYIVGITPTALRAGCYEKGKVNGTFGLPLVAAWRSFPTSLQSGYQVLVDKVSPCFVSTTGYETRKHECNGGPEAHIYPFPDLHVTIATFRTLFDPAPASTELAEDIKAFCTKVVHNSTKRDAWPEGSGGSKMKLRLRPKEVRLGKTNAIILWEETTGNLDAMRLCIKEEMEAQQGASDAGDLSGITLAVPDIVHSTFVRFWKSPSNQEILKHTFEQPLLDALPIEIDLDANVKLAVENTPCMHIDDDETHVIWRQ